MHSSKALMSGTTIKTDDATWVHSSISAELRLVPAHVATLLQTACTAGLELLEQP
jgi:hypothetical protein